LAFDSAFLDELCLDKDPWQMLSDLVYAIGAL